MQLNDQVQCLLKEKNDLILSLEDRQRENNALNDAKQALQAENEMLVREQQNLRFQVQDRDSLIQRLEFKLEREQRDRARGLSNHVNETLKNSRVNRGGKSPSSADLDLSNLENEPP